MDCHLPYFFISDGDLLKLCYAERQRRWPHISYADLDSSIYGVLNVEYEINVSFILDAIGISEGDHEEAVYEVFKKHDAKEKDEDKKQDHQNYVKNLLGHFDADTLRPFSKYQKLKSGEFSHNEKKVMEMEVAYSNLITLIEYMEAEMQFRSDENRKRTLQELINKYKFMLITQVNASSSVVPRVLWLLGLRKEEPSPKECDEWREKSL